MTAITWRFWWSPPFLAFVMSDSASGRSSFARDTVVTMPSAAKRWAAMLAIISFWWEGLPARRGPFFGAGMALLLHPQRQAALVELLDDLFERLLPEVGDGEEVVLRPLHQLADGVDLGPLETVAGPFREVELLDRQVEVERRRPADGRVAQLEAPGHRRQLGQQADQVAQGLAGRGQRLLGTDGAVGLDVEGEPVVVGGLLDPGRLNGEGHPPDGREDRVDRDHTDGRGAFGP